MNYHKYVNFTLNFQIICDIIYYMTNNILISIIISLIYIIFKFLEMRYIKKENRPLKDLILDSIGVLLSSLLTFFLFEQFNLKDLLNNIEEAPEVFTGAAGF